MASLFAFVPSCLLLNNDFFKCSILLVSSRRTHTNRIDRLEEDQRHAAIGSRVCAYSQGVAQVRTWTPNLAACNTERTISNNHNDRQIGLPQCHYRSNATFCAIQRD